MKLALSTTKSGSGLILEHSDCRLNNDWNVDEPLCSIRCRGMSVIGIREA